MPTFSPKVDAWFIAAVAVTVLAAALALFVSLEEGSPAGVVLAAAPVALVAWIWMSTRYVITDRELVVRCAFIRIAVPLDSITHVRRTATVRSAPALSLDRIEVHHASGSVVISPRDRQAFVQTLAARCPAITPGVLTGGPCDQDIQRAKRYALLAILPVAVLLAVLVVVFNFWRPASPRVTVSDTSVVVDSRGTQVIVPYGALSSVTLQDWLPPLRRRLGLTSFMTLSGRFRTGDTDAFVHLTRRSPPYLVLRTSDGLVIINLPEPQRTRALYEAIVSRRAGENPEAR